MKSQNEGWVPCKERLPEEKSNPYTLDYYEYLCTVVFKGRGERDEDVYDVRCYKFGGGHWWHGPGNMDNYVVAWMPRPEPYME